MKRKINKTLALLAIVFITLFAQNSFAQTAYQSTTGKISIHGTSSLHDWDMTSNKSLIQTNFTISNNQVTSINSLSFSVQVESLKSSKSGLDKNAYKALSTTKHKQITFTMTSGKIIAESGSNFKVTATGNLNIAGTSKSITITANGQYNSTNNTITVNGSTKFKMTEYNVKPPTVMLGTIKTGDEITIEYQATLN